MTPVTCRRCATRVLVRKSSLAQTTVQWNGDAGATCAELAARRAQGQPTALVPHCEALRESIEQEVRDGRVPVPEP